MLPNPKAAKRCRLSEAYGHRDTLAAISVDPSDPKATWHSRGAKVLVP